ncbi:macro domain-containing protein [Aeromonas caviae]|uniref:macro domain-containing protein n=1 Tax=Aeromonas caviae TaxID=648 RepID=UPI002B24A1C7|nr:macro domain-containing protein [Aeromonas caviae]MEA9418119.1 macro domain-containing protein [Aeromonas caviae]
MTKVSFIDRRVIENFLKITSAISATLSLVVLFVDIPTSCKSTYGWIFIGLLGLIYLAVWIWSNNLNKIDIDIEGSEVTIKVGDIFSESGFKAIAFNEYFDTIVDNKIISENSLNGIFVKKYFGEQVSELDSHIDNYPFDESEKLDSNAERIVGKKLRYQIGTICIYKDFLLAAFTKFDNNNKAVLTMPEYLEFLINFWDKVNNVYGQQSVVAPIFGSGITRIQGHKTISDEDLLKIMLWTFRISEMRFKYPAKLTIVIHKSKIDKINLLDIKSARNGV